MYSKELPQFKYKNGKVEITAEKEKRHHIWMEWVDLIMKWVFRFSLLFAGTKTADLLNFF